jgi:hypothetical protein
MRTDDPVIDEIRRVRHEISAQFDHDPRRLVEHYIELQKEFEDRLLKEEEETKELEAVGVSE